MIYSKCLKLLWLVTITAVLLTSVDQVAVAAQPIHLSVAESGDFHKAITALSEQGKVVVVAEGVPWHPHLSPQSATKLIVPPALDGAVEAIAKAYDYSVERVGNIFVLRKLYSGSDDFPALTPNECEHAFVSFQQVTEPFNSHALSSQIKLLESPGPHLRRDQVQIVHPLVDAFAASLTPDQLAMMDHNNLLVSSLSQDQQKMARQLRLSLYIQHPMDRMARLLPLLEQAEQKAVFCWQDMYSFRHVFGYTLPQQEGGHTLLQFHPLSHSTGWEDLNSVPDTQPVGPDPTDPSSLLVQANLPAAQTLADAIVGINSRPGSVIHADVDAALATKPVTLAGADNAPTDQVLHALADVYGLRLSDLSPARPGAFRLTLQDVPPPSDLVALPLSLRKVLPEPFARAAHLDKMVAEEQEFYDFWQTPRFPKHSNQASQAQGAEETLAELEQAMRERKRANSGNTDFSAGLERIKQAKAMLPALRVAAIRRLRALVEPKLQAKPSGIVISDLGEPEREALATVFLVEAAQSLGSLLTQRVPDTVQHFDQATLGGGIREDTGHLSFTVEFHIPNPAGGLEINGGDINVPYYGNASKDNKK